MVLIFALTLTALPAFATPAPASPVPQATREIGTLVLDGVPEIPAVTSERTRRYGNTRYAVPYAWNPHGPGMLIGTRFGEVNQVHHVAGPGLDRRQLTFFDESISSAGYDRGNPDGLWLSMDKGGAEFYQLYWFNLKNGEATLLTDGKSRMESYSAARAGGRVAYTSTARNGTDFDLWLQEGTRPKSRLLTELKGRWEVKGWSPDDSRILLQQYTSVNESVVAEVNVQTGVLRTLDTPTRASRGAVVYTADGAAILIATDEGVEQKQLIKVDLASGARTVISQTPAWEVEGVTVSECGRYWAWTINEDGRSAAYLAPANRPQKAVKLDLPVGVLGGMSFDRSGENLLLGLSTAETSGDVWVLSTKKRVLTRWTQSEVGGLDPATFVTPELVRYPSFDKLEIPAWVYRPKTEGKAPVIISIHGGPEGQSRPSFSGVQQYWVNELGAAVILPNVRGSTGYGKTYVDLDNAEKRMDSVKDIGALLDWIARDPKLDASRVAVIGGSYGGFMTLASLVEYGDRIKCGVDVVGISHFVTFLEKTESYRRDLRRVEYGDERIPEMRELLHRISPLTNAAKIRVPLLVGQGANDPRVPRAEAEQIVAKVRESQPDVWYVLGKDEGHGFRRQANREAWLDVVSVFFETYL